MTDGQLKTIRCQTKSWYKGQKYLYLTPAVQRLAATRHHDQASFKKLKEKRKPKPKGQVTFFKKSYQRWYFGGGCDCGMCWDGW